MKAQRESGFTLLEVMVAVAILALALTAIFSSEVGALRVGNRARRTNIATLLARCKMAEIEEEIANKGLPAVDDRGSDQCCDDAEVDGYTCDWSVDRIVLPESGLGGDGEALPPPDMSGSSEAMLEGGASIDGITQMAMSMAFPTLKPALEEQVRRANVVVKWSEGNREMSFDVVQYIVGEVAVVEEDAEGAAPGEESAQ
ncbi:MAG: prepilin-type N-terminal cleavage/methylation domain-containing protein [Polyangiaceae bacterium]|nr:prepilin-type N-terminal cleavage/methylation domain-containing protein [Polyangiaceae bacterium]